MTFGRGGKANASDPALQLLSEHPAFSQPEKLSIISQSDALVHWPAIENHSGEVSIVLRRVGREAETEWRDQLALLRQLIERTQRTVELLALNETAAAALADVTGQPVMAIASLPRVYCGARSITLSRADGLLGIARKGAGELPIHRFNLARLRCVAALACDEVDTDLSDIVRLANGVDRQDTLRGPERLPVVMIVVPNGFGLGHVTRMLAVAQRLRTQHRARVIFWSFSQAAGIIAQYGFETVFRQTARHIGADTDAWRAWETEEFAAILSDLKPDLVVQDAAQMEDFVLDALARPNVGSARIALVRRGMWQKTILGTGALDSEDLVDLVIEPGDLASAADRGITRGRDKRANAFAMMEVTAPVVFTQPAEMMDRKRARKALGLGRGRHCLISLGSDAFSDWIHVVRQLIDAAEKARVRLVWARSPLAAPGFEINANRHLDSRSVYPLAPYFAAFDGIVSAAGYNSFHELMQLYDGPVLFAPRLHSALDDQTARAAFAAAQGWAMNTGGAQSDNNSVASFMADVRAAKRSTSRPQWRDGAAEMSKTLANLIAAGGQRDG